jgi:serine/threonine protein kinase
VIGTRINNYEVKALIGEGGMGSVYLAEHPMIGRQVAVKVLKPAFATAPDVVTRFFNEAKAANAIGHPGIVDVVDVGTLSDGMPYLIMELLRGESLAGRIEREGRLALDVAIEVGRQAASALGAAHAVGIVHRDLKPANLFLSLDREQPSGFRLKVLDFGIAKLSGNLRGDQVKTGTGAVLGTPAYMSPEQSLGRQDGIDHRTDVYALGLILHHALAGAPPFMAEGFGEMVMLHMTAPPPPLRTKNPAVPPALEEAVLRALAKKPEDRFQSMDELGRALGDNSIRVPAPPPPAVPAGDAGQAPIVNVESALPRTVRLPSDGSPAKQVGSLSTTLSSSAAQVRPRPPATRGKGARIGLVAGAVGLAGVLVLGAVTMLEPTRRERPRSAGAAAPTADPAPPRDPRPLPPPPPTEAVEERAPAPSAPEAPPPAEAPAPTPARRKMVRTRPRTPSAPGLASSSAEVTTNVPPPEVVKAPKPSLVPAATPGANPDAGARRMKKW